MSHTSPTAGPATSPPAGVHASAANRSLAIPLRPIALIYRVIALALIVTGIVRITGLFTGEPVWNSLLFYTVQSNVLCLVWMAVLVWATVRDLAQRGGRGFSTPSPRVGGAVMMAITVTMLVYLIVLVPASFVQNSNYEPFSLTDNLIHIITPCLIVIDWALFTPKGSFRRFDPLLWALIPCAYLVFALTYGGLGGEFVPGQTYAYPFLDVASHGWGGVFARVAVLAITLIGVGYVFFALDRLLAGRRGPALPGSTGR